jgi:5-hydroxyisourate hydrolase-like protein (transthyretin family)
MTLDLVMQPGAALEGRIVKENGDPAANMVVSAVRMAYDVNGRRPTAVRQVRTDDLGRFRVHTLPPGEYQLDAAPDPLDAARQPRVPGTPQIVPSRTYFPGSARLEDARTVTVTVGQTAGSLDFTMTSVSMATLRGKVITADGNPANGASVRLQRVGGVVGEVRGSASIESNDFTYSSVPAGEFWMMGVSRPAPGADPEFGVLRITMEGRDEPGLIVPTVKQPRVTGRVEGVAIPAGLKVVANETAFEWPSLTGEAPFVWSVPVAPDGSFTFPVLPGPRLFRLTGLPAGVAIKSVLAGDAEIADTPLDVSAASPPPSLRIVLTPDTATLSGLVSDDAGKPVTGARVVLFGDDERLWGTRSRTIHATETRADGTYEIAGVLPGKYHVVAVPFLDALAWTDATVLHQLMGGANSLNVAAGKVAIPLVVKR